MFFVYGSHAMLRIYNTIAAKGLTGGREFNLFSYCRVLADFRGPSFDYRIEYYIKLKSKFAVPELSLKQVPGAWQ